MNKIRDGFLLPSAAYTIARAKMVLNIGTSMNSRKSATVAACCWALTAMGHKVRGAKVTGTAGHTDQPIFNSLQRDLNQLASILL